MSDAIKLPESTTAVQVDTLDADIATFGLATTRDALNQSNLGPDVIRGMLQAAIGAKRAEAESKAKTERATKRGNLDALVMDFVAALADPDFTARVGTPVDIGALTDTLKLVLHVAYGVAEPKGGHKPLTFGKNGAHRGVYPHGLYRSPDGVEFRIGTGGYTSMSAAFADIGGEKKSGWAIRRFNTESVRIAD